MRGVLDPLLLAGHQLENPQELVLGELRGALAQGLDLVRPPGDVPRRVSDDADEQQVPPVGHQVLQELRRLVPLLEDRLDDLDEAGVVAPPHRVVEIQDEIAVDDPEDGAGRLFGHGGPREGDHLVQSALRVAQRPFRHPADQVDDRRRHLHLLPRGHAPEVRRHLRLRDLLELEVLAARQDRERQLPVVGRREQEDDVRRRLLQGLEERVPRLVGEHVHFVDDVDLVAVARRGVAHRLPQLPHRVDAAVAGAVDLQDVHRARLGDLQAGRAGVARDRGRPLDAVERLGHETRHGRLADAAQSREEVGVVDAPVGDGVLERGHDRLLADDLLERLRPVLAGEDLVAHGGT